MALIDGDPIGMYLRNGERDLSNAEEIIRKRAKQARLPLRDYWALLKIYNMVDGGAYTEDAGARASFDSSFVFDPKNHRMSYAPDIAKRYRYWRNDFSIWDRKNIIEMCCHVTICANRVCPRQCSQSIRTTGWVWSLCLYGKSRMELFLRY